MVEHPDPVAAAGTTLVRVTAAPVVPLDLLCASGTSCSGRPAARPCPVSRRSVSWCPPRARIRQAVGAEVELVVDPVSGAVAAAACSVLAPGGRLVDLGWRGRGWELPRRRAPDVLTGRAPALGSTARPGREGDASIVTR